MVVFMQTGSIHPLHHPLHFLSFSHPLLSFSHPSFSSRFWVTNTGLSVTSVAFSLDRGQWVRVHTSQLGEKRNEMYPYPDVLPSPPTPLLLEPLLPCSPGAEKPTEIMDPHRQNTTHGRRKNSHPLSMCSLSGRTGVGVNHWSGGGGAGRIVGHRGLRLLVRVKGTKIYVVNVIPSSNGDQKIGTESRSF